MREQVEQDMSVVAAGANRARGINAKLFVCMVILQALVSIKCIMTQDSRRNLPGTSRL